MKFLRSDSHKKKRLSQNWRKPKGLHNKMRLQKKGYRNIVKVGYRGEAGTRGTYKGLAIVRVATVSELEALDPKTQSALLEGVGRRRKEELIALAEKKNITLVNLSVSRYKEMTKKLLDEKKAKKAAAKEAAEKKAKKEEDAKAEAKKEDAESTEEDKKAVEKKEKDKLLTSKKEQY